MKAALNSAGRFRIREAGTKNTPTRQENGKHAHKAVPKDAHKAAKNTPSYYPEGGAWV